MQAEMARRRSLEDQFYAFILAHPHVWVPARELNQFGAWRSRLPYVRRRMVKDDAGVFVWNGRNGAASAYMYRMQAPLGRPAHQYVSQVGLF